MLKQRVFFKIPPKLLGGLTEQEPDGDGSVSVEILEISSSMWHKMPALPHPMYGGVCWFKKILKPRTSYFFLSYCCMIVNILTNHKTILLLVGRLREGLNFVALSYNQSDREKLEIL